MANTTIQLKHSTLTGNVPSSLANGEISINNRDGKFFYSTPAGVVVTHYPYLGPAGLNQEIQFNDSGVLGSNSDLTFNKSTGYLSSTVLRSSQSSGDEGGQLDLATAATNNSLSGGFVNIDIYQNKLRIFESGGTNRGVYIDMANGASAGVGTNLLEPASSTDGWARGQANASFAQANSAASYANSAFAAANTGSGSSSAGPYANAAFAKANSAYSAAQSAQSTADSAQSTATAAYNTYDIASIYTPNNATTVSATGRSDTVNFVGESGVVVYANSSTKTITVAGTPGAQGLTVDYGFVADPIYYSIDYGSLA